jgi:hypothetical protein
MIDFSKIDFAKQYIDILYKTDTGSVGGYGHIVFDDSNIDDGFITGCIEDATDAIYKDHLSDECRIASLAALQSFLLLSYEEREICLGIQEE